MIKINSAKQAATVTDQQLPDIDFNHLLETYQRNEFDGNRNSLFMVLMCLINLRKDNHTYTLPWIIENVGSPDYAYFEGNDQENGDLFYILEGNEHVGHVRIRQRAFGGFGTVDWNHFETVCLPLDTWHDCVERLRPKH